MSCSTVTWTLLYLSILSLSVAEKYRICVVDGKGQYKRSLRNCPSLDRPESQVECVVALDRLDCLRKINKGIADFAVFSPEDLVTANNEGVEILVTNELRFTNEKFDYEVVAIVDNAAGISTRNDLKGTRYCHPGYGYESDWNRILANYFESSVVIPSCDLKLTITENRIKATAQFFKSACKAGPWISNPLLEMALKSKYSNLCELCGDANRCSMHDKYWGRRGSLLCLTDGAGDISWARWDDTRSHFGLVPGHAEASPDDYSLLCPDDTTMPVNTTRPCLWVVRPWPVIASRRTKAQDIQKIISSLDHKNTTSWKYSLLSLIETSYTTFVDIDPVEPIESYLDKATGFLSANSFSGCHPPRTIQICTTSILENAKCSWLRESAAVYGIEPDLECLKADNVTHCMRAVQRHAADVVMVPSDLVHHAMSKYNLTTLFYETVNDNDKYLTVAVTRPNSKIATLADLRGKKACFPVHDGVAWNSIKHALFTNRMIRNCPLDDEMASFFGPGCTPGLPRSAPASLSATCKGDDYAGEFGALRCLLGGGGDVAFLSRNSLRKFLSDEHPDNPGNLMSPEDFEVLFCGGEFSKFCPFAWAPVGEAMVRRNSSELWISDTLDVFLQLDKMFGKEYQSLTNPFTMFGKFDGKSDVLFKDVTARLRPVPNTKNSDTMPRLYKNILHTDELCIESLGYKNVGDVLLFLSLVLLVFFTNHL